MVDICLQHFVEPYHRGDRSVAFLRNSGVTWAP